MNSKVSIIVPIYNTGEYLRECIESLVKQTYSNIQIILIDDGSQFYTASLCDELSYEDSRIRVVHKKNEGVSVARNVGLELAHGDIICFVDSDDTIQPDMIERLVTVLHETGSDIVICDATTILSDQATEPDTIPLLDKSCILNKIDITPAMLTQLAGSAWRCAYRRTAMLAKQAKFPVGIKFSEDRIFNIIAMGLAHKIAYIKESYYNRLLREGSACFRFYPDMTEQIAKMRNVLLETVNTYWGPQFIKSYEAQMAGQIRYAVTNYTASSNGLSFLNKFRAVKGLCANADICSCIANSEASDMRSKMIIGGNYVLLTIIGVLTNKYHRLCKIGQYR